MKRLLPCVVVLLSVAARVPAQDLPSYAKHIRPFLVKYCVECHNAKVDKRGLNLETYKSLEEGSDLGPVIVPGKPQESKLVKLIESTDKTAMPPKTAKRFPTKTEVAQVRAWVKAGAKDDSAAIKVAIPDIKPHKERAAPAAGLGYQRKLLDFEAVLHVGRGKELFSVRDDGSVAERIPAITTGNVQAMAITADHTLLAVAFGKPGEAPQVVFQPTVVFPGVVWKTTHSDGILDLAFHPEGRLLATASYDTTVKLCEIKGPLEKMEPAELRTLKEHSDAVYAVAFSKDGKRVASGGADRAVKVWEAASGKLLYTLGEANDWVYAIAFSPDGKHLAAAGVDKSIRVWQVSADAHKLVHSVFAHEAPVLKLVYAADGKTLYSLGEDRIVKAWDAGKMVERKVYERQPETVLALALSPDQKQLALGRYDGVVVLLDVATGKVQREIGKPGAAKNP